jgi:hypothetical protein
MNEYNEPRQMIEYRSFSEMKLTCSKYFLEIKGMSISG